MRNRLKIKKKKKNRLKIQSPSNVFLCCYHRYTNGIAQKQPSQCQHPNHKHQAGKKAPPVRTISLKTFLSFNNRNRVLPIGVVFCYTHLKEEEAKKEDKATEQPVNTSPIPSSTPVDEDFLLVQISLSNGTISTATETATSLCSALKVQ